jgi:hypothetical protein
VAIVGTSSGISLPHCLQNLAPARTGAPQWGQRFASTGGLAESAVTARADPDGVNTGDSAGLERRCPSWRLAPQFLQNFAGAVATYPQAGHDILAPAFLTLVPQALHSRASFGSSAPHFLQHMYFPPLALFARHPCRGVHGGSLKSSPSRAEAGATCQTCALRIAVTPAKGGIHSPNLGKAPLPGWIPAFPGMTGVRGNDARCPE